MIESNIHAVPYFIMKYGFFWQTDLIGLTPAFEDYGQALDWVAINCTLLYSLGLCTLITEHDYLHLPNLN